MKKLLIKILFLIILFSSNLIIFANVSHKPLQKLTVILDWYVNPDHAPLFVAQQQGYYRQQGLDVQFITPADPSDPPKLVAVGKADIAIDYQPHFLLEISQGLPLVQIGTLINTPLCVLGADPSIKEIKDLKGKRIGYSVGGVDVATLQGMLLNNGLSLKDVELVDVKYNLTQGLLAKKIDAAIGLMRNVEMIQLQLLGHPMNAFYPEKNGVPPYDELILVTNRNLQNDPRLPRFLAAVKQGVKYLKDHPEKSWQEFSKQHPELNNELNLRSWFATLSSFATDPTAKDKERCEALSIYLRKMLDVHISQQACS